MLVWKEEDLAVTTKCVLGFILGRNGGIFFLWKGVCLPPPLGSLYLHTCTAVPPCMHSVIVRTISPLSIVCSVVVTLLDHLPKMNVDIHMSERVSTGTL